MRDHWRRGGLRRQPLPRPARGSGGDGCVGSPGTPWLLRLLCLLLGASLAIAWSGAIPSARADGGAPNLAYIVGGGKQGDELVVVDIGQRRAAWSVALGSQPQGVVLSPDARFAYVTEAGAGRVAIVDTRARQVDGHISAGSGPQAIAVDPSGGLNWLFVANRNSNTLSILDTNTQKARATLPVGQEPVSVAVATPSSGIRDASNSSALEVYVANRHSQTLSVISTGDLQTIATVVLPEPPCALTIPATGGVAYVATCSGKVLAVGLASHQVLGTLFDGLDGEPGMMDYDAVTGQIYVPVLTRDQVVVLRPAGVRADGSLLAPAEPLRSLSFSGAPSAVAITFDGALGFFAGASSGQVAEIDVASRQTLGTVSVGGSPRAIITGPYPPALDRQASSTVTAWIYGAFAVALAIFLFVMVRGNIKDNIRSGGRTD
jgi:YVTN family beta-propeller protein